MLDFPVNKEDSSEVPAVDCWVNFIYPVVADAVVSSELPVSVDLYLCFL